MSANGAQSCRGLMNASRSSPRHWTAFQENVEDLKNDPGLAFKDGQLTMERSFPRGHERKARRRHRRSASRAVRKFEKK
jgi:hypothetical protein